MPTMILRAVHSDEERRRWALSDRIVDEHLGHYRHVPLSSRRPRSATAHIGLSRRDPLEPDAPGTELVDVV